MNVQPNRKGERAEIWSDCSSRGGKSNPKARPYRLIGGATEQKTRFSDILAIARKPIVENSKTLHFGIIGSINENGYLRFHLRLVVFPPF